MMNTIKSDAAELSYEHAREKRKVAQNKLIEAQKDFAKAESDTQKAFDVFTRAMQEEAEQIRKVLGKL